MQVFLNRHQKDYQDFLLEQFSVENLIHSAITLDKPNIVNGVAYHQCIRIDFAGIAATTLLDRNRHFTDGRIADCFESVFQHLPLFETKRIFIKFRFLFAYLYSDFSFSVIQSEMTDYRATVETPKYPATFDLDLDMTENLFQNSGTYKNQRNSLEQIERILRKNPTINRPDSPHRIDIRFTPICLNLCMLTINNMLFSDAYVYARRSLDIKNIMTPYPVLSVTAEADKPTFSALYNSFIYLWDNPATLYCEDATFYDSAKRTGISLIKLPSDIQFTIKAQKHLEWYKQRKVLNSVEPDVKSWQFQLVQYVRNAARIFKKSNPIETIFIACSWDDKKSEAKPNLLAAKIEEYLNKDFKKGLQVRMVRRKYGSRIFDKIYSNLQDSTLGIVILTKDVEGKNDKFYAKPNIYHELGFLMGELHHLNTKELSKVLILKEEGVEVPSNVPDYDSIKFHKTNFSEKYESILDWLKDSCATITEEQIKDAKIAHRKRMKNKINKDLPEISSDVKKSKIPASLFATPKKYIADGKLGECIIEIQRLLASKFVLQKADLEDILLIQQSTLSQIKLESMNATMDIEVIMRKRNEIIVTLLSIMRTLEQQE